MNAGALLRLAIAVAVGSGLLGVAPGFAQQLSEGDAADSATAKAVADAVRAQGLACTEPVSAARDAAESKPDEPVWLLACRDVRYRVRLRGDMPAKIERLQ